MANRNEKDILLAMANGIDPISGKMLPEDHLCRNPEVRCALYAAVVGAPAIRGDYKGEKMDAGRKWTEEDSNELKKLYCAGMPMRIICERLQRRERGVQRQLVYLGLIEDSRKPTGPSAPGMERAGRPWTREEDDCLKELHNRKWEVADIAAQMQRSEYAVFCRMEKLELYGEEQGYPSKDVLPPWTNEDNAKLREMFQNGSSIAEIAVRFGRTEQNISARLFYMGLTKESPLSSFRKKR